MFFVSYQSFNSRNFPPWTIFNPIPRRVIILQQGSSFRLYTFDGAFFGGSFFFSFLKRKKNHEKYFGDENKLQWIMKRDTRWMELSIFCCVNSHFFAPFCFEITVKTSVFILKKKEFKNGGTKDIWFSSYYLRLYLLINLLFHSFTLSHRKKQKKLKFIV